MKKPKQKLEEVNQERMEEDETDNAEVEDNNGTAELNGDDNFMDVSMPPSTADFHSLKALKLVSAVIRRPQEFCKKFCKSSIISMNSPSEENPNLLLAQTFLKTCGHEEPDHDLEDSEENEKREKKMRKLNRKLERLNYVFSCESDFFKSFLKYGMRHPENTDVGSYLVEMLISVLSHRVDSIKNPTLGIQMMLSHSQAEHIFLEKVRRPQKQIAVKLEDATKEEVKDVDAEDSSVPPVETPVPVKTVKVKEEPEKFTIMKTSLLKLWKTLIISFTEISRQSGTEVDKRILENSVPYLMQMYGGTMSPSDLLVFDLFRMYTSPKLDVIVETLPLFGPKCFEQAKAGASNPLYAHSTRANTILTSLIDTKAYYSALQFDPNKPSKTSASYDLRFLLPLLCHILDERNVCDGGKVIGYGWVYFIAKGMCLEDLQLRTMAFLAYHRLVQCFHRPKAFRSKDTKIYLHFLTAVKRGIKELGECKISNLLATWLIFVWDVLRQPSNSMFKRVTNCLFAKPIIEMTILPDFVPFYNDGDDNKESRTWILNVLYCGLKSNEDWKIAKKSPTIKFLCASFDQEKVKTQKTIITILSRGAAIPEVAESLVHKYCILLWMSNITTTSNSLKIDLKKLFDNLVSNCSETETTKSLFEFVRGSVCWIHNVKVEPEDEIEINGYME